MKPEYAVADASLDRGVTLIEASAGTGKTYTIAGLFLRLIVEEKVQVREILVTTYTVAATAELRARIRELLRLALEAAHHGESRNALIQELLARDYFQDPATGERLGVALRAFDEAAIHTIHGFCERILRERALESGALFDAELLTDQSAVLRELAEDYWRIHFHAAAPVVIAACLQSQVNPASLAQLLRAQSAHPRLRVLPPPSERASFAATLGAGHAELCRQWPEWRAAVGAHFSAANQWAIGPLGKTSETGPLLELVELCAQELAPPVAAFAALDAFTAEHIAEGTGQRATAPDHPFFQLCTGLAAARAGFAATVESDFLGWARAELPRRLATRNVVSFDGLLTRLRDALAGPGGAALAATVGGQFRAALVDEFQDTDPTQAEIFQRLFARDDRWLFLIGDPKQAIYGFRGADVQTYLAATERAAHQFRLGTNQRSTRALVAAVNAIFQRGPERFMVPGIAFDPVAAAGRADAGPLLIDGKARAPFRFWLADSGKPLTIGALTGELPARIAAEIARLLQRGATLDGAPLAPQHFAVLTLSNDQARAVRDGLSAAGLPSVLLSDGSVFASDEAAELRTVLSAIVEPARHGLLRAALATALFARSAAEIDALTADEHAWENWLLRFQGWNELWRSAGFMRMFRTLLRDCGVRPRLLSCPHGERALTNLLHLSELLHQAASEQRLAPFPLLHWLATRQHDDATPAEEHELRLERDDDAVKIVTVHKSKGLEYDIVICPFAWGSAELRPRERPRFHDARHVLTLDLHQPRPEESAHAALHERLQEQTRLLYVALTRARHECHFVWGRLAKIDLSAGHWLLHPPPAGPDPIVALQAHAASLTPEAIREEIVQFASQHPEAIAVDSLPDPQAPPLPPAATTARTVGAREFRHPFDRRWRVSSFTSLTEHRDQELPDYDRAPAPAEVAEAGALPTGIHAFPAGKTAGICLHAIFEDLDFTQPATIRPLVEQHLARHAFSVADWAEPVAACVRQILRVELAPGLRLGDLRRDARLAEVEFYFQVAHLDADDLSTLLREAGVERLSFDARHGLLKGFIDLVFEHGGRFYLADWKSNWLGSDAQAYASPALRAAMAQHRYGLQYHLYTLALHRYLRLRLGADYAYERHFGGVFYVFLRGVDPTQPELGIFRDRPPRERIEALDALFAADRSTLRP